MTRRDVWTMCAAVALAVLVAASAPAFPQDKDVESDGPSVEQEQTVETILRQQEELLKGQRFSYDPGGRRDPFRSLYETVKLVKGPRPKGVAGMLVTEIDLVGTIRDDSSGDVAFFMGPDNKGYFLRVGDQVYDGTLIAIDTGNGAATFRQQVDDPRLIKPYRDVQKRLVPQDEENAND
jgi:hypothetical protein